MGSSAVGAMSHIYWPSAASWYAARIVEVDPGQHTVTVAYEDGRTEALELAKEDKEFKIRAAVGAGHAGQQ